MGQNDIFKLGEASYIEYEVQDESGLALDMTGFTVASMRMYFQPVNAKSTAKEISKVVDFTAELGSDGIIRYFYSSSDTFLYRGDWSVWCKVVWSDGVNTISKFTEVKTLSVKSPWEV